jgi:hypothetical protein
MPTDKEYKDDIIELILECQECDIEYSIFTGIDGFVEEARHCPFCGEYNLDYDRVEE